VRKLPQELKDFYFRNNIHGYLNEEVRLDEREKVIAELSESQNKAPIYYF
jgi:hypothetical protein